MENFFWLTILVAAVSALIAVLLFRKFVDRKSIVTMGFNLTGYLNDAVSGFLLALSILGIGTIILYFRSTWPGRILHLAVMTFY